MSIICAIILKKLLNLGVKETRHLFSIVRSKLIGKQSCASKELKYGQIVINGVM